MMGHGFNWVDYSIISIIVASIIISVFRGFVREAVSFVVWVVGVLVALKFATVFQAYLPSFISSPIVRYGIAFLLLFLAVFIVGIVINFIVHAVVRRVGLSATDRVLGLFFGAARGLVVAAIFLMFVNVGEPEGSVALTHSQLAPPFEPLVAWLEAFLPEQLQQISRWGEVLKDASVSSGVMEAD